MVGRRQRRDGRLGSGEEREDRGRVVGEGPALGGLAIANVIDLRGPVLEALAVARGRRRAERDGVLVVGDDVMELVLERYVAHVAHAGAQLVLAAARLRSADLVPDDV